jgi:hypothetical protein
MNAWQQLTVNALLGTQKNTTPIEWPSAELASANQQLSTHHAPLLAQLALMSVYQRAGQNAIKLTPVEPAQNDTKQAATLAQQQPVAYLLSHEGQDYLSIWLKLAAQKNVYFPYALLPNLLNLGSQNKKWRLEIGAVAGTRGTWLALQNSEWAWLIGAQISLDNEQLNDYWHSTTAASRELIFERLRQQQPAQALVFLQQIWGEETAATRKNLLEKLLINLTFADHEFLEQCLDDRSKIVKEVAVDLLARVPQSNLQQRMQQQLSYIVTLKKGLIHKSLLIDELQSISESLERDGLNPKAADIRNGLGEKAQWLRDIVACVSLEWLSAHYQMPAQAFITAALKTDWAEAILTGLATAAVRQAQSDWLVALLEVDSKKLQLPRFLLFNALANTAKEAYVLGILANTSKLNERASLLSPWLYQTQSWAWSTRFTIVVMDIYQQLLKQQQSSQLHHYLARCGDMSLAQQANQYPQQIVSAWQFRLSLQQAFI